jgi:hypothetical protein
MRWGRGGPPPLPDEAGRRWEKRMTRGSHGLDGVTVLDEVDGSGSQVKEILEDDT